MTDEQVDRIEAAIDRLVTLLSIHVAVDTALRGLGEESKAAIMTVLEEAKMAADRRKLRSQGFVQVKGPA